MTGSKGAVRHCTRSAATALGSTSGTSSSAGASMGMPPRRAINSPRCAPVRVSRIATTLDFITPIFNHAAAAIAARIAAPTHKLPECPLVRKPFPPCCYACFQGNSPWVRRRPRTCGRVSRPRCSGCGSTSRTLRILPHSRPTPSMTTWSSRDCGATSRKGPTSPWTGPSMIFYRHTPDNRWPAACGASGWRAWRSGGVGTSSCRAPPT